MGTKKKKINVIRPTLRHKKVYLTLGYSKKITPESKKVYRTINENLKKTHGLFITADTNLTVLSVDDKKKEIFIRINRDYLKEVLSSFFFLDYDLGIVNLIKTSTTIKKSNKKLK